MKIVGFKDFCKLPNGTVFQEIGGNGGYLEHLSIRGDVLYNEDGEPNDFVQASLVPEVYLSKVQMPSGFGRWALYDDDARFLVFEKEDLERLAGWLLDPVKSLNVMNDDSYVTVSLD